MANGSSPRTKLLTGDVTNYNKYHPFSALNKVRVNAPTGGNVYGVNKQGHYNKTHRARIVCDGTTTTWTSDDFGALLNAEVVLAAGLTNANRARVVAVVNNGTVLTRKGSDATLSGGDCQTVDNAGVIEFSAEKSGGGAFGVGTIIDVFLADADDVVNQTVTSGIEAEIDCYDFMVPDEDTVISCL